MAGVFCFCFGVMVLFVCFNFFEGEVVGFLCVWLVVVVVFNRAESVPGKQTCFKKINKKKFC